ncbi:MAG: hypothetical protein DHS20C10_12390 [marine bacterium B5-7]|nr:MAG: hypothetical protein DHS20C10_12390 [marine bacterium B5-7]
MRGVGVDETTWKEIEADITAEIARLDQLKKQRQQCLEQTNNLDYIEGHDFSSIINEVENFDETNKINGNRLDTTTLDTLIKTFQEVDGRAAFETNYDPDVPSAVGFIVARLPPGHYLNTAMHVEKIGEKQYKQTFQGLQQRINDEDTAKLALAGKLAASLIDVCRAENSVQKSEDDAARLTVAETFLTHEIGKASLERKKLLNVVGVVQLVVNQTLETSKAAKGSEDSDELGVVSQSQSKLDVAITEASDSQSQVEVQSKALNLLKEYQKKMDTYLSKRVIENPSFSDRMAMTATRQAKIQLAKKAKRAIQEIIKAYTENKTNPLNQVEDEVSSLISCIQRENKQVLKGSWCGFFTQTLNFYNPNMLGHLLDDLEQDCEKTLKR